MRTVIGSDQMRMGIDIGGTKAALVLIGEKEEIIERKSIATGAEKTCRAVAADVIRAAEEMLEARGMTMEDVAFVGVGVPGTVDGQGKTVLNAPNLRWKNEPLAAYIRELCGKTPVLVQDTRAAAWCEARRHRDKRCVVCVTLGTGIGCGIVIDGHIWHGALGTAGEVGHIPVVVGGETCACGKKGCLEAYTSGTGIARSAKVRHLAESSEEVFALAKQGDEKARALLSGAVTYAAVGICAIVNILSPDAVIFSGGLSGQKEYYVEPLMDKIRDMAYRQATESLCMEVSSFGGEAPAIGAAFMDEDIRTGGMRR